VRSRRTSSGWKRRSPSSTWRSPAGTSAARARCTSSRASRASTTTATSPATAASGATSPSKGRRAGAVPRKERLELALDGGNLAEFHFDAARGELSAGDGWVRFLGHTRSPTQTLGADLIAMMHPEDRVPYTEALVRALRGDAPVFEAEFRIRTLKGDWKWLHARGRVTEQGAGGRAKHVSGTVADIDERKRVEAALAEREQRFRDVVDASGEFVWETDAQWRYTYLSERAEAVLGYSRAELLGARRATSCRSASRRRWRSGSPAAPPWASRSATCCTG